MHPYDHALSSTKHYTGEFNTHLSLHNHFDRSKACFFDPRHRLIHHHVEGAQTIAKRFQSLLPDAEYIATLHLVEDFNQPNIYAKTWLNTVETDLTPILSDKPYNLDYVLTMHPRANDLKTWLFEPQSWVDDHPYWPLFRMHAQGCFEAEDHFGIILKDNDNIIPTRVLTEKIIRSYLGRVPTYESLVRKRIPLQKWMTPPVKPIISKDMIQKISDYQ